ncbi:MAG TPA: FAD binding domain-containing protein [Bacteroidales bacterium]|nr:FAD binding domain-containing protein [Bacteroidales bacterium]HPT12037.1 FAD binding domain-containing protein [Bacteroidales bacterium]
MVTFILNNKLVSTDQPSGSSLLDYIRYEAGLPGTKIGCREGDCGACTVLAGTLTGGVVRYKSVVSCLTPLANANGKHIVTIEGINTGKLSPVQQAFLDNAATQCGFCTPGFIMSLTGEALSEKQTTPESAVNAISGNICRCTGYKSIERAAETIATLLKNKEISDPVGWLVRQDYLPGYFLSIPQRLNNLEKKPGVTESEVVVAGGTDLMVQKAEEIAEKDILSFSDNAGLKSITIEEGVLKIGAATTLNEIKCSEIVAGFVPGISPYLKLIASEPVRNMATVAGNIVNASPIGDFTIMLLALNAEIVTGGTEGTRIIPLNELYAGYKKLTLKKGEYLKTILVRHRPSFFSFEKVSKRTHLDIASVNSAVCVDVIGEKIISCSLSAGGVAPVPLFLKKTGDSLTGVVASAENVTRAASVLQAEISPISDVRGSDKYKRLLLRQLFFAHMIKIFPDKLTLNDLV